MADEQKQNDSGDVDAFSREAEQPQIGFVREFVDFLRHNKKWWLTPIVIVLLLVTMFIVFAGGALSPFMYTFF